MASSRKTKFGTVRKLPSGRYQARYTGPDGLRRKAPVTFDTIRDAQTWLATIRADIVRDTWSPTKDSAKDLHFDTYAETWLEARPLEARTRAHYRTLLDRQILP